MEKDESVVLAPRSWTENVEGAYVTVVLGDGVDALVGVVEQVGYDYLMVSVSLGADKLCLVPASAVKYVRFAPE